MPVGQPCFSSGEFFEFVFYDYLMYFGETCSVLHSPYLSGNSESALKWTSVLM